MSCNAIGNPLPVLTWIHNNNSLVTSSYFVDGKSGSAFDEQVQAKFVIKSPSANIIEIQMDLERCSAGLHRFDCIATNKFRQDQRNTFVESISEPTFSTSDTKSLEIIEGHPITIDCDVIAYPMPEIIWLKVCKSRFLSIFTKIH